MPKLSFTEQTARELERHAEDLDRAAVRVREAVADLRGQPNGKAPQRRRVSPKKATAGGKRKVGRPRSK